MPAELLPIAPPTELWLEVAGSGANIRPCGARSMFRRSITIPGSTRQRMAPASSDTSPRQCAPRSSTTARFTVWPLRLVPPPRGRSGTPRRTHQAATRTASSTSRGTTTTSGSTWYMLASVAYRSRSPRPLRTSAHPSAASSAASAARAYSVACGVPACGRAITWRSRAPSRRRPGAPPRGPAAVPCARRRACRPARSPRWPGWRGSRRRG